MADAAHWLARHGDSLPGSGSTEAGGRAQAAGLTVRLVHPGETVTLEFRPDRITLELDDAGLVRSASAG